MESDTELELFDNFCVKYVGAIDKSFKENSFNDQSVLLEPLYWSLGWMPNKPRICYFINFIYLLCSCHFRRALSLLRTILNRPGIADC